ncbi:hypothetical protein [Salinadaptatus halalkaliphilus]|nr:hypothetical protein [Salinadaptatus halalkaliphilus]
MSRRVTFSLSGHAVTRQRGSEVDSVQTTTGGASISDLLENLE